MPALGRRTASRPAARPATRWEAVVERIASDLELLNRSTERDFLAVGGKLMEFHESARRISADMNTVTALSSGDQGGNTAQALTEMVELAKELDRQTGRSGRAMESVDALSRRIALAFSGLGNTVSVFRTLCTLTRIETSRLGSTGTGFGDLADEVKKLAESIQASGEGVLESSAQLGQRIQSALQTGAGVQGRQLKEVPALIEKLMNSLGAFDERQQESLDASVRQAAQYRELVAAIENLVTSVQFHDITRQQVEHVIQALRRMCSEYGNGPGNSESLPPKAKAVLVLQYSQLASAGRVFAASVERIERDLDGIAGRSRGMAAASLALTGTSENRQDSFSVQMEACFDAILKAVDTCAAGQTEAQATAANLTGTIARMWESVAQIRGIEVQIQRIAINATIRAVHIGTAGNALGVIAPVMHGLALDSSGKTEDVAGALAEMTEAVKIVGGGSDPASGSIRATSGAAGKIRAAMDEMHSSSEIGFSRVMEIADLGSKLGDDIGALRSGFAAGRLFAEVVERARTGFAALGAVAVGAAAGEGDFCDPAKELDELARHYTMQAERDVHEAVARGSASAAPQAAETAVAVLEEGDLGDNVELF